MNHIRSEGDDDKAAIRKNLYLQDLHNRNETLYHRVLVDNVEELAPLIYTPTVGHVCQQFGDQFRRSRGMYFSREDRGLFSSMCAAQPQHQPQHSLSTASVHPWHTPNPSAQVLQLEPRRRPRHRGHRWQPHPWPRRPRGARHGHPHRCAASPSYHPLHPHRCAASPSYHPLHPHRCAASPSYHPLHTHR
jgi:hypothetical protein